MKLTGKHHLHHRRRPGIGAAWPRLSTSRQQSHHRRPRKGHPAETLRANQGTESVELDIADPAEIAAVARDWITSTEAETFWSTTRASCTSTTCGGPIDHVVAVVTVTTEPTGADPADRGPGRSPEEAGIGDGNHVSSVPAFVPLPWRRSTRQRKAAIQLHSPFRCVTSS